MLHHTLTGKNTWDAEFVTRLTTKINCQKCTNPEHSSQRWAIGKGFLMSTREIMNTRKIKIFPKSVSFSKIKHRIIAHYSSWFFVIRIVISTICETWWFCAIILVQDPAHSSRLQLLLTILNNACKEGHLLMKLIPFLFLQQPCSKEA